MKFITNIVLKLNKRLAMSNMQLAIDNEQYTMDNLQSSIHRKILPIACCLLLVFMSACNNDTQKKKTSDGNKESNKTQKVEVVHPQAREFTAEVLITGRAMPNQKVMLYAMESGYVKAMRKDIGDKVKKGEVIAILDNPELYRQLEKLKAQLQAKKSIYERLKSIREKTPALTTIQQLEEAEADFLTLQAEKNAINDRIGFLTINAPFDGVITQRFVDNGALLQNGLNEDNPQSIAEIQQTDPVRITVPLPERDATAVRVGMDVKISFPELPGESFQAKITRMANALDPGSKTMQVEIDIPNPDNKILTGMYAKALMQISGRKDVPSLPHIAKTMHQDEAHVLIVKEGIVERIPLRIGLTGRDYFEVLNPEITKETQVIVQGKSLVKPGQIVEPIIQ